MTASPRNLDPKFKDADVTAEDQAADETTVTDAKDSRPEDDETPYIVHRRQWTDNDGIQQTKEDRMTLADYPAYQKKYGV